MASFVDRITLVSLEDGSAVTLYKKKKKKRKVSRFLKPAERGTRRMADAMSTFGEEVSRRHRKSSRKRRDGWLRDAQTNLFRSQAKAAKKFFRI